MKCGFPRRTLRIINIPKESLMILRGPIPRNHENPPFSVKFNVYVKNRFPGNFIFVKFMHISRKLRCGENGGFPEVAVAYRFLFNLRGFRVRRENHGIQQILCDFHEIPHHSWPFAP